jgi:hypothetical protein
MGTVLQKEKNNDNYELLEDDVPPKQIKKDPQLPSYIITKDTVYIKFYIYPYGYFEICVRQDKLLKLYSLLGCLEYCKKEINEIIPFKSSRVYPSSFRNFECVYEEYAFHLMYHIDKAIILLQTPVAS